MNYRKGSVVWFKHPKCEILVKITDAECPDNLEGVEVSLQGKQFRVFSPEPVEHAFNVDEITEIVEF